VGKQLIVTEPKTEKSRRTLPLSPAMIALLRRHRASQRADQLRAGSEWAASGHVFTSQHGTPLEPRAVLRALATAAKAAGLTGANVHTLRHSAATGWIENGVSLKAVSEALGHSSIAITGDVYAHVSEQATREAMTLLSDAIGV
jgi:integrase